ncbi:hypothetical protein AAMO2058_000413400 [Amorphochlora amoebiformis]
MGRGAANMGKTLKGRSRGLESDKKKTPSKGGRKDFDEIKARWHRQAGRIKENILREEENARVNERLVTTILRTQLRKDKMSALHDGIAVMAQAHQREMDRKDGVIQTLQGRLGEVEDQFLVLQRSHIRKLEILNTIHQSKVRQLESEFERDLKILKNEFNTEREHVERSHDRMKKELKAIIKAVEKKNNASIESAKTNHETVREEIKNKNLEQINELRIHLENKIDELEQHFNDAHNAYQEKTKEKNKEFKKLQDDDKQFTQENKRTKRKINKLQKTLSYMKHEIEMNRKECNSRNHTLREQCDLVAQHCRGLKARMAKLRETERRRLTELTVKSRRAQQANEKSVASADRILKLMEAARKMETEREKVLPFYTSTVIPQDAKELAVKQGEEFEEDMKAAMKAPGPATKTDDRVQWNSLQNFHKKYNKVLLDKLAIEQEKKSLIAENEELKAVLQRYLDSIAITETAVDGDNSLLIVNGRIDAPLVPFAIPWVRSNACLRVCV